MRKCLIYGFLVFLSYLISCNKKEPSVKIIFTGDLLLDRGVKEVIEKKGGKYLFKDVEKYFHSADFVVANLECPITNKKSPVFKKYIFRGDPAMLPILKKAGITHLNMANNHTYDQGRIGLRDTYQGLLENDLTPIGYGRDHTEACNPVVIEKEGIRIAMFASVLLPLENWVFLSDSAGACRASVADMVHQIKIHKKEHRMDIIVLNLHWGVEFQKSPTLTQRQDARSLIDAGVDVIIGHHPHVVQKKSIYKGKPIFYSLGNFIFDQKAPASSEAILVELEIRKSDIKSKLWEIEILNCRPDFK